MASIKWVLALPIGLLPTISLGDSPDSNVHLDLTHTWAGYFALTTITLAYIFAMLEDVTYLRKSKPMLLGASMIWIAILVTYRQHGGTHIAVKAFEENLLAYMELLLFIMVSMTYLNAMEDMKVFDALRIRLVQLDLSYRALFWVTGILIFLISSVINGLTAGLLMGAVIVAVGRDNPTFVSLACINVVVACNAGGSFSPLGGISTLFVWQGNVLKFTQFLTLFLPCLINFLIPATLMSMAVPPGKPDISIEHIELPRGTKRIISLFGLTIALTVIFNMALELPPVAGMMAGFSLLQFFEFYLMKTAHQELGDMPNITTEFLEEEQRKRSYAIFEKAGRLEWDTLLFFYGAMMGIGGLGFIGYLDMASSWLYGQHSVTLANILIGLSSAFVDNGTLMFAVLSMRPDLSQGQWLLVTLTLGVGGSLLAIGSAPGIGLLGLSKGKYTFASHMKWCPAILLGYLAAIGTHFLVNARYF
ncbi:sodium:proton antiporter NhaD [Methyloparacoccus murrellii]